MTTDEPQTDVVGCFWVQTPWRSWGVVTGASREEAIQKAEADRQQELKSLEAWIGRVRRMKFTVEIGMTTDNTADFAEIRRRMEELNLQRDRPFSGKLEKDFHQELNDKLKPKPNPDHGDEVDFYGY